MKPSHQIVEVSASSTPKEVIGAIVAGQPATKPSNRFQLSTTLCIQLAFAFIVVFGIVVYFREEIYTFSKDVSKHPILAAVENQQLHKYIGSNWVFGSGKEEDRSAEIIMVDVNGTIVE